MEKEKLWALSSDDILASRRLLSNDKKTASTLTFFELPLEKGTP
jgi:hypothetical protein